MWLSPPSSIVSKMASKAQKSKTARTEHDVALQPTRNAPKTKRSAPIPALQRLREEIGEDILFHLHREGNGGLNLDFQTDCNVRLTHFPDGLRIGEHEIFDAHGWAYYIKEGGLPAWNVWLYNEEGGGQKYPRTKKDKSLYDPKKGFKMTYEDFCYDDEFKSCKTTKEIRALTLYYFLIHAEETAQSFPDVTISDSMLETLRHLCEKQRIENERVIEENWETEDDEGSEEEPDENESHAEIGMTSKIRPQRTVKAQAQREESDKDLRVTKERVAHSDTQEHAAAFSNHPSRAHISHAVVPELDDSASSEFLTDPSKAVRPKRRPSKKDKKTKKVVVENEDSSSGDQVPHAKPSPFEEKRKATKGQGMNRGR
jgi:hypothetical protein